MQYSLMENQGQFREKGDIPRFEKAGEPGTRPEKPGHRKSRDTEKPGHGKAGTHRKNLGHFPHFS
jgi:hypothetical protein